MQQTSLHPSKSIVHVKLGVEQQLWHWPFSKKKEKFIWYEDNITNSPGLSCLYEAQKKIKSSTLKTTAKSKYKTITQTNKYKQTQTNTTTLLLLLIIITYIFFIYLCFYLKKNYRLPTPLSCVLWSGGWWNDAYLCWSAMTIGISVYTAVSLSAEKKNRFINKEFINNVFTVLWHT